MDDKGGTHLFWEPPMFMDLHEHRHHRCHHHPDPQHAKAREKATRRGTDCGRLPCRRGTEEEGHGTVKVAPVEAGYHQMEVSVAGVLPHGWFTMENPLEMDDLGVPPFLATPTWHWF